MFKMLNPRRFYHAVGKKKFLEFILLAVFILFFYGPLLNMLMLAFANEYNVPSVLPQEWGFKWWGYVFGQKSLVSSMIQSFIIAIATTVISMIFCIPAAYSLARFQYPGRKVFMLSFLLTNAFPKLGIYTSIAVLFYKYGLMGTYAGVIIIHMINSMMFMVWLPSSAFRNVHRQQEEAARDAGASPVRTFFKVTLPMAMPGIAVATLYTVLGSMEEAQGTMLGHPSQLSLLQDVLLHSFAIVFPLFSFYFIKRSIALFSSSSASISPSLTASTIQCCM